MNNNLRNRKSITVGEILKQPEGEKLLVEMLSKCDFASNDQSQEWAPSPPDGMSLREQARWWLSEIELFLFASINKTIPEEVMQEIERCAKDNDLAMKIADRNKVKKVLTNKERARLFSLLTDGGELVEPKQGRYSKVLSDLYMAYSVREISDPQEKKQLLRDAIINESGAMAEDSIYKRIMRIKKLWQSVSHFPPEIIETFVKISQEEKLKYSSQEHLFFALEVLSEMPKYLAEAADSELN
jgi:hypothetical protein